MTSEDALRPRLLEAAGAGDRAAVAEILDAKCDVNGVDAEGWSPLILASKVWHAISLPAWRDPQITQLGLGSRVQGSGFRVQGSGFRVQGLGFTTRAGVQQAGNMDMVEYLLERGAAPNPPAIAHTALRAASIFGHEHIACMLLQAQADPNMCRWGITAREP
jgi:hypothetical protein